MEGEKFLYRVALELALQFEKHKKEPITLEAMRQFCENITEYLTPSQLISNASKVSRLSRKGWPSRCAPLETSCTDLAL